MKGSLAKCLGLLFIIAGLAALCAFAVTTGDASETGNKAAQNASTGTIAIRSEPAIPAQGGSWVYTVRRGDTLFKVAQRFGFTPDTLRRWNGLRGSSLRIGQRLTIPPSTQKQKARRLSGTGEVEMLARIIHAEAQAEPYTGKVAVGAVVLNRVRAPGFPNSVSGVIYQPHAFESVSNGWFYRPAENASYQAARAAVSGWDPTGGALYFFNPAKTRNRFIWSRRIVLRIGKHVFAL